MFFDTHAHLDQQEFDADRGEVIARARAAGVETVVCVGVSAASSRAVLRTGRTNTSLLAAVGIHPNSTAEAAPDDWHADRGPGRPAPRRGHGRDGARPLPGFRPLALQQEYLDRHLRLAQKRDLPVIIHCRDAQADLLPMLRAAAAAGRSAACCTPSAATRPSPPSASAWGSTSVSPAT